MKLLVSDDNIIVFLSKKQTKNISFNDKDVSNQFLAQLILKLKKSYKVDLCGYYSVIIHLDDNYGAIIEFEKEKLEYFDYYEDQVDLDVKLKEEKFVYEIDDFNYFDFKYKYIKIKDKIYLILDKISEIEMGKILEYSKIIYGIKAKKILEKT